MAEDEHRVKCENRFSTLEAESKSLFKTFADIKADVSDIRQNLNSRLPVWVTVVITFLSSVAVAAITFKMG